MSPQDAAALIEAIEIYVDAKIAVAIEQHESYKHGDPGSSWAGMISSTTTRNAEEAKGRLWAALQEI